MANARRYRIALDAMGGDYAPGEVVKGAVEAAREGKAEVLLVGEEEAVRRELRPLGADALPVSVVPSWGVVREGEHAALALRQQSGASVAVAARLVKDGRADAMVTMGSTGAAMAAAVLNLGLFPGLERPALGGPFLGLAPKTSVLDLGSHVDARPSHLLSFAALGSAFARFYLGIPDPRVALLSVGAEEGKGNRQVLEAAALLRASGLNFVGNVEGHDIPLGKADVVVCDGFVGNILLKYTEGLGAVLARHLRQALQGSLPPDQVERLASAVLAASTSAEQGGGPLFGVNGVVVVGHGRSRAAGVAGAVGMAARCLEHDLVEQMRQELANVRQRAGERE
ncbi:MAG: phosphate acyltransferase PlsX [Chloroflexi bacterium]|nr:phosphate acyltransferase PlsX [Chloroflexota bacterium]